MKQMKLGAFLTAPGHHLAAWRHPRARPENALVFQHYLDMARAAERGKFDMIFLSDGAGVRTHYRNADELSRQGRVTHFEPLTLLSALAVTTRQIGLTATVSTTYNEPFHVARKFASLDYLSQGRAGWNIVTSVTDAEAMNFNLSAQPDHETRYRRAREFTQVVTGLWDSWEDGAFVYEKAAGRCFNPEKMRVLEHGGEFFSVRGPLNVDRPPQGYPVLIQAGSSDDGQDFAAQWAEVVFTAQPDLPRAQAFYAAMREQVAWHGRDPDHAKILPGLFALVGKTQAEADDKYAELQGLIDPVVGLSLLTSQLGDVDLSGLPLDAPLPDLPLTEGSSSRQKLIIEKARRENLTVRQLFQAIAGGRGHRLIVGTPQSIADEMEAWFTGGACDGFNFLPPCLPDSLTDFVDLVVPELQRRGLFRQEYAGSTLREHLGLPRPAFRSKS